MGPNDTLVAKVEASSESGADPYWYLFHLYVPGPCGYLDPISGSQTPGFAVTAGDTLEVEFAVTCSSESPWNYARLGSKAR